MRRILLTSAFAAVLLAVPATAHDLWLQPASFWIAPGGVAPTSVQIGHGRSRERWSVDVRRVVSLRSFGPGGGVADRLAEIRATGLTRDTPLRFAEPGVHVLALESSHATSELPAVRFNDYLQVEGLTPAAEARRRAGRTNTAGREIYSRRAKALLQVGAPTRAPQPQATARLGMTLELVPERNPYALRAGEALPVRVYYQGRPLPGALVKLYDLAADEAPVAAVRSDRQGRVLVRVPRQRGAWLLNVLWTRPIAGDPRGDFDTTFSSLSFGWSQR